MTCECASFPRAFINGAERSDNLLEKKSKISRDFFPKDRKQHCDMNKTTSHQTDPASTSAGTAEQQVVTQMIDEWFDGAAKPSLYLSTDGESILTSEGTPDPEISAVCFPIISPFSTTSSFSVRPAQSSDDVPVVYTAVWGSINRELARVKEAGYQYDLRERRRDRPRGSLAQHAGDRVRGDARPLPWIMVRGRGGAGLCFVLSQRHGQRRSAGQRRPQSGTPRPVALRKPARILLGGKLHLLRRALPRLPHGTGAEKALSRGQSVESEQPAL